MQRQLSYHYKYAPNLYAIDAEPTTAPLEINGSEMSASCRLASTKRDREGDIYEVQGLLTDNHRANPIALVDHGLYHPWPIGKCESPKGRYAVEIVGDEVLQTTWFSQKSLVAAQIYQMILDGDMRGNSIGYRPIEQRPLEPDPEGGHFRKRDGRPAGWHILRSELIEATWTCRPMNPDCVRRIVSRGKLAGKTLAPSIKAMLSEVDPGQRAFLFFDRGKSCGHDCECGPCKDHHGKVDGAMSAVDSGSGGALVPPPTGPGRSFKRNPPTSYGRRLKPMGYGKGRYDEYGRLLGKAGVGAGADENTRSSRREAGQGNRDNAGDVDDADDIEENGHPYGAQVLKAKCMDMADHVKTYMKAMTPLEHEGTKKCLMKCMRSDVDNMKTMEKHWNKTYKADHGAMGVDMPKFDEEDDDQVDMDEGKDMDAVPKKDVVVKGKAVESTNTSDQEDHGDIDPKYLEALQKLDETFDRINARVS